MTQPEQSLAAMLKNSARALAGYAAGALSEAGDADAAASGQFKEWQNVLAARLEELGAAVLARQPKRFVEQIRWARAALEARGVSAARLRAGLEALRGVLAEQIPPEWSPLAIRYLDRALAESGSEPPGMTPRLSADTPEGRLAAEYLVAILEGDRRKAAGLILRAADEGKTVPELYLKVLQPAQEELGRMWLLDEINVAEEHFATATTRSVMAQLQAKTGCKPPKGKTLLAAAVVGNQHELGIQAVADLFEMDGWRVIQLGANVPAEDLAQAVDFYQPDLVGLSVSLVTQLPSLKQSLDAVRASRCGAEVKILVGGPGIAGATELARAWGFAAAANAQEAVERGNALVALAKKQ